MSDTNHAGRWKKKTREQAFTERESLPPQFCISGKIRHPSRQMARSHLSRLRRREREEGSEKSPETLHVYRCLEGCGCYHVGHSSL